MAKAKMILPRVKVLFSNVVVEDSYSGKFQITVDLTEAQAADAEAVGVAVKTGEYEGKTQFKAVFKSKFSIPIKGLDGQSDVDLQGSEIGRGSIVSVQYGFREWTHGNDSGKAQDLQMIQILDLKSPAASGFGDESAFTPGLGDEDSDI